MTAMDWRAIDSIACTLVFLVYNVIKDKCHMFSNARRDLRIAPNAERLCKSDAEAVVRLQAAAAASKVEWWKATGEVSSGGRGKVQR